MFFKKSRATKTAIQAVLPLVRTVEMTGGLPKNFWRDPYVLGFLSTCIGIFAKLATGWKIAGSDLGYVIIGVFDAVAQGEGREIARRITEFQSTNDPDFARGVAGADKVISVTYGLPHDETDPDIIKARKLAQIGEDISPSITNISNEMAGVGGALQMLLFYDVVRSRLGNRSDLG